MQRRVSLSSSSPSPHSILRTRPAPPNASRRSSSITPSMAEPKVPGKLILVRHGQSIWNLGNLFTGWTDVDLTETGHREAADGARPLLRENIAIYVALPSVIKRGLRTLWISLDEMDRMWIPVERSWRLNERHYGALQGLNKAQTVEKHGEAQVKIWRRSYDIPPPKLELDDPRHPRFDARYAGV